MEEIIIDKERVNKVLNNIIDDEKMFELAEVFKLFGDTTRMKIFCALKESELCVYDIAYITKSTQSAISHQLKLLQDFGTDIKEGEFDDRVKHQYSKAIGHISHTLYDVICDNDKFPDSYFLIHSF